MRIPEDIVIRLNELPIESVAEKLGLDVNRHRATCFMHDDKHPSLEFSVKKNIYYCFVCGEGGGPIKLVRKRKDYGFQEACVWLAGQYNIPLPAERTFIKISTKKQSKPLAKRAKKAVETEKQIDREIGEWIVNHAVLSDQAKHFLFEERKYKPEVVEQLKIGSLTYPKRLTESLIQTFGIMRCEKSGFFTKWRDGLRICYKAPCLLFPYYDEDGELYCIQSRFLGDVVNKKNRFKFPQDIKQRLYNRPILNDIKWNEPLYVCEGVTDCIAMLSSGKKAVAFPSSSICHPEDVRLLSSYYLFMYPDKDPAGEGLYKRLSDSLKPYSNVIHKVDFPEGFKDYSEYYLSMQ